MRRRVGDEKYRITRASFDVISVFPALAATAVPGPVFSAVLQLHGYGPSAVRNRLVRMVHQGQLVSDRSGRASLYRVHPALQEKMDQLRSRLHPPTFDGHFHMVVHAIPESERQLRDRLTYLARYLEYRALRPGVLLGFVDRSERLSHKLRGAMECSDDSWFSFGTVVPPSEEAAESWVRRAFLCDGVSEKIGALEARIERLAPTGDGGELISYMDALYDVLWLFNEVAVLPAEFTHLSDDDARLFALLEKLDAFYREHCDIRVVEKALSVPAARLIEYEETDAVDALPKE